MCIYAHLSLSRSLPKPNTDFQTDKPDTPAAHSIPLLSLLSAACNAREDKSLSNSRADDERCSIPLLSLLSAGAACEESARAEAVLASARAFDLSGQTGLDQSGQNIQLGTCRIFSVFGGEADAGALGDASPSHAPHDDAASAAPTCRTPSPPIAGGVRPDPYSGAGPRGAGGSGVSSPLEELAVMALESLASPWRCSPPPAARDTVHLEP